MKRSVIQLAGKTHVISLPSKWIKKYGVKKGDELELEEKNDKLVISKTSAKALVSREIELNNYGVMARRVIGALYKKGYDEVKIYYNDPTTFEVIQKEIDSGLIGFEIISHGKNHCVAKMIASQQDENFDSIYRRIFFIMLGIGNESVELLNLHDREKLNNLILRDKTINKLADYCRRIINKSGDANATFLYDIVENLEKIGDEYRDLFKHIYENNITPTKGFIEQLKAVNSYFELFYKLFYNFEPKGVALLGEKKNEISQDISKMIKKSDEGEIILFMYLDSIVKRIYDLNGVLLQMRL